MFNKMYGTWGIMIVWSAVWIAVMAGNAATVLSGKGISLVGKEYYRFFTAGLTHVSFLHLAANLITMYWIGTLYESHLGTARFLAVGLVCAVVCEILFLTVYPHATDSVGGSGWCFALCGFGLTLQLLVPGFPRLQWGTRSGNWLIGYLIVGNLPVLSFMSMATVVFHAIAFGLGVAAAFCCRAMKLV